VARKCEVIQGGGHDEDVSIFDDLDALRVPNPELLKPERRARCTETFARIPHRKGLELVRRGIGDAGWGVLLVLDHLILRSGNNPVRLSTAALREYGIDHRRKWRALRKLQALGVVTIEQGGRRAPLVTHQWFPVRRVSSDA
jgi:hypothetical protein